MAIHTEYPILWYGPSYKISYILVWPSSQNFLYSGLAFRQNLIYSSMALQTESPIFWSGPSVRISYILVWLSDRISYILVWSFM